MDFVTFKTMRNKFRGRDHGYFFFFVIHILEVVGMSQNYFQNKQLSARKVF